MKLILFFILLLMLMISSSSYSQSADSLQTARSQLYKKARSQKTIATVMLAGGGAFVVTGFAIAGGRIFHQIGSVIEDGKNDGIYTLGSVFFITGITSMLGSIPLFISATNKRNQANSLAITIKNENSVVLSNVSFTPVNYPAISVKINF